MSNDQMLPKIKLVQIRGVGGGGEGRGLSAWWSADNSSILPTVNIWIEVGAVRK